jgi:hypothetical protein
MLPLSRLSFWAHLGARPRRFALFLSPLARARRIASNCAAIRTSSSLTTCVYTSRVSEESLCPRGSWRTFNGTLRRSMSVLLVCRKACNPPRSIPRESSNLRTVAPEDAHPHPLSAVGVPKFNPNEIARFVRKHPALLFQNCTQGSQNYCMRGGLSCDFPKA